MTDEQFARWEEFAVKMAEHCFPESTEQRRQKILARVNDYFEWRHYQEDWSQYTNWDYDGPGCSLTSDVDDYFYDIRPRNGETNSKSLFNKVTSCIRAGFDVAVKPSGGVIGFTAGDVRGMWDGAVPDWVKAFFEEPFDNIPDDDAVWL